MIANIHSLLHELGVTATYRGFSQTTRCVILAVEDMERLLLITKLLYNEVAKEYHTTFQGVERNIKTVVQVAWRRNRPLLEQLAQAPLTKEPTPSQFVEMLARQFLNGKN